MSETFQDTKIRTQDPGPLDRAEAGGKFEFSGSYSLPMGTSTRKLTRREFLSIDDDDENEDENFYEEDIERTGGNEFLNSLLGGIRGDSVAAPRDSGLLLSDRGSESNGSKFGRHELRRIKGEGIQRNII